MILYNIGLKPTVIGKTKEGFPLVIQPGKHCTVSDQIGKKILETNKNIVDQFGYNEKKEKDKKSKKVK